MTSRDWSEDEVRVAVDAYLDMLALELRGQPFVKAQIRRDGLGALDGRSEGAWERKLQNVSAVAIALGCPYVDGYKPLGNYQKLLGEVFENRLDQHQALQAVLLQSVANQADDAQQVAELPLPREASPPKRVVPQSLPEPSFRPRAQRNYLELEANNRTLGLAGELAVLQLERMRLESAGRWSLAKKVEHVAASKGDGLGYDVHSFELDGNERLLEVKTTRFGEFTPFFASRNEIARSHRDRDSYHLVRLYSFGRDSRYFTRKGPIDEQFAVEPHEWRVRP